MIKEAAFTSKDRAGMQRKALQGRALFDRNVGNAERSVYQQGLCRNERRDALWKKGYSPTMLQLSARNVMCLRGLVGYRQDASRSQRAEVLVYLH